MSDLVGNHIVGFPTRRLICIHLNISTITTKTTQASIKGYEKKLQVANIVHLHIGRYFCSFNMGNQNKIADQLHGFSDMKCLNFPTKSTIAKSMSCICKINCSPTVITTYHIKALFKYIMLPHTGQPHYKATSGSIEVDCVICEPCYIEVTIYTLQDNHYENLPVQ